MKVSEMGLRVYRSLYWANQGLLQAVRALGEAEVGQHAASANLAASALLNEKLRRTKAMIEETRLLMNHTLAEWIEPKE